VFNICKQLNDEAQKIIDETSSSSEDSKPQKSSIAGAAARRISSSKQGEKFSKKRHSFPTFQAG